SAEVSEKTKHIKMSSKNFTYINDAGSGEVKYFVPNDTVTMVTGTKSGSPDRYDSVGALKFIIVTVVFYSIFGVLCALSSKIMKRKTQRQDMNQDENIASFLKLERKLKMDGYKMRMMIETRRWRQKYSRDKDNIARTKSLKGEKYDSEHTLEDIKKRNQLDLCQIKKENEISHVKYSVASDISESFNRHVDQGFKVSFGDIGEKYHPKQFQNKSKHLSVSRPPEEETSSENLKSQSTHRSGLDLKEEEEKMTSV
ncbi:hypothetical protein CHS0354_037589, partial [Potamilus streckersoni]